MTYVFGSTTLRHSLANSKKIGSFMAFSMAWAGLELLLSCSRYSLRCLFDNNSASWSLSASFSRVSEFTLSPISYSSRSKIHKIVYTIYWNTEWSANRLCTTQKYGNDRPHTRNSISTTSYLLFSYNPTLFIHYPTICHYNHNILICPVWRSQVIRRCLTSLLRFMT